MGSGDELDFVTLVPIRQYKDFIFFERAEPPQFAAGPDFDFARSEDKDVTSEAKMTRLRDLILAKARQKGAEEEALKAIETYFAEMSARIRRVERDRLDAEPRHLEALLGLAARAYRRPLTQAEREQLLASYRDLRQKDELGHEDAIRDLVAGLLMSPQFLFRYDPAGPGERPSPLSDHALASRLSYFLWSSMPDEELLSHADSGDLHEPRVIAEQARRMLRDVRARGLATEFAGNWLDFRRFDEHNGVDRDRFPSFTNDLRRAMAEEPIRFFLDVASHDRSILEFVNADHTFVNPVLARHYGMPIPNVGPDEWVRVEGAHQFGRGGVLPMSAFLTANSPGLRTSPVKRGYWVVRRLLGEQIPAPPPDVPELPRDEAKTGELTLPQLLARHRSNRELRGVPPPVRLDRPGVRGLRPDRRPPRPRPRRPTRRDEGDLPRRPRRRRARRPPPLPRRASASRLRRQLLPEASRLRTRPDPDALRRPDHPGDARPARRRRSPLRRAGRGHRHQPPVSDQTRPG